eukprot:15211883-Ditylum_brightwellii.AAC.1
MKIILADIWYNEDMASSMMIGNTEARYMGTLVRDEVVMDIHLLCQMIPHYHESTTMLGVHRQPCPRWTKRALEL